MNNPIMIGRVVWYRSKTGRYTCPAIITAITATLYQPAVDGGHIKPLTDETHVHLHVLTPGIPGERLPGTDPSIGQANPGGYYQEFDVPFWDSEMRGPLEDRLAVILGPGTPEEEGGSVQPAGTWTWPVFA